jgi:hypothetical protein
MEKNGAISSCTPKHRCTGKCQTEKAAQAAAVYPETEHQADGMDNDLLKQATDWVKQASKVK